MSDQELHFLDENDLDKIWKSWIREHYPDRTWIYKYSQPGGGVSRKATDSQKFEDYLWQHGAEIVQIDCKRKIRFRSASALSWFILKHL